MTRNTVLILLMGLIAILSAVALKQRSTIALLRREMTVTAEFFQSAAPSAESVPIEVLPVTAPTPSVMELPAPATATTLAPIPNPVAATNQDEGLRRRLEEQVQLLQAELERVKRLVPEPEDARDAYVGPGVWFNVDLQTSGTKKIAIFGEAKARGTVSKMTLRGWGTCFPMDCEWPEVPFYLLDQFDGPRMYRRGFAAWESESGSRTYLLVTFEKSGLRIDKVRISSEARITPRSSVERMTRIQ